MTWRAPSSADMESDDRPLVTRIVPVMDAQFDEAVVDIDWSPAERLAVLCADGRVMIDAPQRSSDPVGGAARSLSWVNDGLLAVADRRLGVVMAGGGDPRVHPLARATAVRSCAGRLAAIGGSQVWSLTSDAPPTVIEAKCGELHDLTMLTASLVAVVGTAGLALVDLALGIVETRLELDAVLAVAVDPAGDKLAAGDLGGSIHVLHVGDETNGRELTGYPDRVRLVVWADHGRWLLAAADDELTCWPVVGDPGSEWPADEPEQCHGHDATITSLAATPTHDLAATGDATGRVAVWSLRSPHEPVCTMQLDGEITATAWSRRGTRLAVGDVSGRLEVCSVERGQVV